MANIEQNKARLLVVATAVLFSTGGAGIKVEAFSALQVSMVRSGVAAAVLLIWLRGAVAPSPGLWGVGVVYSATLTLFVAATKLTTAANAIFLQSAAPLYLLLLAPMVLQEPVRRRDFAYVAAVAGGMVLCFVGRPDVSGSAANPSLGNLLGAASGLAWALTLLTLRKIGRDDDSRTRALSAVVAGNLIACVGAAPFALPLPAAPTLQWATLVYLGVFQVAIAYVCLSTAIRHLPALDVSLLLLLEPVLNPVWVWIFRDENPGPWTIAGGAVIVGATAVKVLFDGGNSRVVAPAGS